MKRLRFISCLILFSCGFPKKASVLNSELVISKTECSSYEVKSNNRVLGYVVQPFYTELSNMEQGIKIKISSFENLLLEKYSMHYYNSLRVYHFTTNRVNDTIVDVLMLTKKQADLIKNWRCDFLDVDSYKTKYAHKSSKKYPDAFIFNCSKGRFNILGDSD